MKYYLQVLKKYAAFSGRARRKEYWMFALFNLIFLYAASIIDMAAGTTYYDLPYGVFYSLYTLAVLVPGLAVTVRRLHDVGKSGWMILIALIPIIGVIWLLILMVQDSEPGKNDYGENPKEGQKENFIADQKTSSNGASKPVPCRGWVKKIEPSNVPAMLSAASGEAKVPLAIELLKSSDYKIRAAVASEVARLKIKAVGVWYELANALADDYEPVKQASAKAFWELDGIDYAIRSLRDEHENPAHMNRESALRGIRTLMEVAPEKSSFDKLLKENWQDCPNLKRNGLGEYEHLTGQKDSDERPECAKCGHRFKWDEAYMCQNTPGAMPYTPQGYGDDVARVFCPHCGAIVVQWHITSERDYDEWVWFGKNATINQGRPLPPCFLLHWGLDIPLHLLPDYHEKGLDIEKIQQYHIEEKAQRQKILEKEKKSKEKDDIDWSKVNDFYDFASTLISKGDFKGAEKAYRLAIEEKTLFSVAAHNGLGQLLERQERYDEAIEIYKKATVDYTDNGVAFQNLAFLLINLDRLKEAEAIYEKAMKIAPGHPITDTIKNKLEEKKSDEAKRTGRQRFR